MPVDNGFTEMLNENYEIGKKVKIEKHQNIYEPHLLRACVRLGLQMMDVKRNASLPALLAGFQHR